MFVCHCQDVELGGQSCSPATWDPAQEDWRTEGGETSPASCFSKPRLLNTPHLRTENFANVSVCVNISPAGEESHVSRRSQTWRQEPLFCFGSVWFWLWFLFLKITPAVYWQPPKMTNPSRRLGQPRGTGELYKEESTSQSWPDVRLHLTHSSLRSRFTVCSFLFWLPSGPNERQSQSKWLWAF